MNKFYLYIIFISLAVLSAGCSRPAESEFGSIRNIRLGNEILGIADRQLNENNIPAAQQAYLKALKEFSLIDHQEGKARAYLGLIKVCSVQDSLALGWNYFSRIEKLQSALGSELQFLVLAGKVEWYSAFAQFDSVLMITDKWRDQKDKTGKIVLVAHRLNAYTALGKSAGDDLQRAESIFESEYDEDPYKVETGVKALSDLSFAIAQQNYLNSQMAKAEKYFTASLVYDKVTGKYPGIAENLYMLGLIASGAGNHSMAEDYLSRSMTIIEQIGLHSRKEYVRTELALARIKLGINTQEEKGILKSIYNSTSDTGLKGKISNYIQ